MFLTAWVDIARYDAATIGLGAVTNIKKNYQHLNSKTIEKKSSSQFLHMAVFANRNPSADVAII